MTAVELLVCLCFPQNKRINIGIEIIVFKHSSLSTRWSDVSYNGHIISYYIIILFGHATWLCKYLFSCCFPSPNITFAAAVWERELETFKCHSNSKRIEWFVSSFSLAQQLNKHFNEITLSPLLLVKLFDFHSNLSGLTWLVCL